MPTRVNEEQYSVPLNLAGFKPTQSFDTHECTECASVQWRSEYIPVSQKYVDTPQSSITLRHCWQEGSCAVGRGYGEHTASFFQHVRILGSKNVSGWRFLKSTEMSRIQLLRSIVSAHFAAARLPLAAPCCPLLPMRDCNVGVCRRLYNLTVVQSLKMTLNLIGCTTMDHLYFLHNISIIMPFKSLWI